MGSVREVLGLKCAEPGCDGTLVLRWTDRYSRWFYGCDQWPKCSGILPANNDGSPKGEPRTRELQGWRNKAHNAFDPIWREGHCTRPQAYLWLQEVMNLSKDEAHMFMMDMEQCKKVIETVKTHGPGTLFWTTWKKNLTKLESGLHAKLSEVAKARRKSIEKST